MPALDFAQKTNKNNWFFNELKYHRKFLLKSLPLLIGYLIFLFYFIQNDFYPNMDIFSWGSLLIAAFFFGMLLLLIFPSLLMVVGYFWSNLIVNDKHLLKKVMLYKGYWSLNNLYLKKITGYYLLIPLFINNLLLGFISCIYKTASGMAALVCLLPMCLGIISTIILVCQLYFPFKLCLKYFITIVIVIFFSSIFCTIFSAIFQDNIHQGINHSLTNHPVQVLNKPNETKSTPLKNPVIVEKKTVLSHLKSLTNNFIEYIKKYSNDIGFLWFIFMTTLFTSMIIISFLEEISLSMFAMIVVFSWSFFLLTNVVKKFPAQVVKILNIGHYQAAHVYLTPEGCQHLQETQLFEISQQCSLENIKVLWDIGGSYVFKVAVNGEQQILSLDKKEIRYVLKSKKPSTACRPQPTEEGIDKCLNE